MIFNAAKPRLIGRWYRKQQQTPHERLQQAMRQQDKQGERK